MLRVLPLVLAVACTSDPSMDDPGGSSSAATVDAIPRGSTWSYWDRGGDLGTAWRAPAYDDSGWESGAGPLGYGETYHRTTIDYGPNAASKYITSYFRASFTVSDPAAVTAIRGELMYDDGLVVYLNGTLIGKASMPSGTINASTEAIGHETGNAYEIYDWSAHQGLLVAGENTIAVEVHQSSPSSSDLTFDLALALETTGEPPPPVDHGGIGRTQYWTYWDQGGDQGTAWRTTPWETLWDLGWEWDRGSFGYGETYHRTTVSYGPDPAKKYITTYFRNNFDVENPSAVTTMIGSVMYDDGFVVYINGFEVGRASMPSGPINASTEAIGHETGNAYETFDWSAHRNRLLPGRNEIAVEVHQSSPSSSDLSFDLGLELTGDQPPPPPDNGEDIERRSTWTYWDGTAAPSNYDSWAGAEFDDTAWKSGPGPLGYGESYVATKVSYGPDPSNKTITAYFRRWFTVDEPSIETRLIGELMYDDGVVVHLNGHEIARLHMPTSSIEHTTEAIGHETGNAYETFDWSQHNHRLVTGLNLIAVEVHQSSPSSSDLTFDLALDVDSPITCGIPGCGPTRAPPPASNFNGVWVGHDSVWVAGGTRRYMEPGYVPAAIGRRLDAEGRWCWCAPDPVVTLHAMWGSDDDDVWFVGGTETEGRVYHYDGTSLATVDVGAVPLLRNIWGSGPDDIFIVGHEGTVRHFDGTAWTAHDLGPDQMLLGVWGASAADVWVTGTEPAPYPDPCCPEYDGSSGIIYRWQPATGTWVLEKKTTMYYGVADYSGIHGTGAGNVWAVGSDHPAGAACSISRGDRYDGSTWSQAVPYPYHECHGFTDVVAGAPGAEDGVWIFGRNDQGGALRYRGGDWSVDSGEVSDDLVDADYRGSELWAVGDGQKIVRWTGSAWESDR